MATGDCQGCAAIQYMPASASSQHLQMIALARYGDRKGFSDANPPLSKTFMIPVRSRRRRQSNQTEEGDQVRSSPSSQWNDRAVYHQPTTGVDNIGPRCHSLQ
ncbi:hypothetical protein GE21DRAFT_6909 [Neurospora crassa]|uniref:Uncharacterized protein n=1 Tax=Neurospora crassa (strain ATCC 24698 / 74-OR23-1A / CBS 708.71 / DSM 1257 / FGSC 987) TaxID=367110 RepID=Q7S1S9_NEUCR|nr:hypothetical protein NCU07749 [Neurospora crassa OR74A]EAA29306.1 hypothetical protein NCU07749 [Neurospora crassa OR74A]KHE85018.1 hypothetical protein GE21DRAFT_6909 [Neurospora crassa]|eukprot:XP_958542.1 hypothetical protein NCU07749 [Neurospora crassa OR74A]